MGRADLCALLAQALESCALRVFFTTRAKTGPGVAISATAAAMYAPRISKCIIAPPFFPHTSHPAPASVPHAPPMPQTRLSLPHTPKTITLFKETMTCLALTTPLKPSARFKCNLLPFKPCLAYAPCALNSNAPKSSSRHNARSNAPSDFLNHGIKALARSHNRFSLFIIKLIVAPDIYAPALRAIKLRAYSLLFRF